MATLTTNLFHGTGATDHRLEVVEGSWPTDLDGAVIVVGPDKREPGGHWFGAPGLLCRIECTPDAYGRIAVRQRHVRTPLLALRERVPWLFARVAFAEVSPFGLTNLANTNVEPIEDRLFVGYDAGRPVEVDPETLGFLTPVGSNREWFQALPGLYEPMVAVAAHPAAAPDEPALYFVNYTPVPSPDGRPQVHLARWPLDGPIERWELEGVEPFDTIHDVKATRDHIVFADLPFATGPEAVGLGARTAPNADVTHLTIVAKADLRATPRGRTVRARSITLPMPTGHLSVDHDEVDGVLTAYLEHIPLADLMVMLEGGGEAHGAAGPIAPDYEGLVSLAVQPGAVGRYRIDTTTGEVLDAEVAWDDRFWGQLIATRDRTTPDARRASRQLWFAGLGFDPELVPEQWWRLYGEAGLRSLVPPAELPGEAIPAALARFDLEAMELAEIWTYADGAFPSPPQFVPRSGSTSGPDDGYVVVLVHQDGDKEIQVFDALAIERGPIARATVAGFNPPLLLHSCWMPPRSTGRRSDYRVSIAADVWGAVRDLPRHLVALARTGRTMKAQMAAPRDEVRSGRGSSRSSGPAPTLPAARTTRETPTVDETT
jgi:carotenoid cleavage dioxygenase-like enzyme